MITVNQPAFARALDLAAQFAPSRPTVPVLGTVRLTANGALALEATDLDIHATLRIPYDGDHARMLLPEPAVLRRAIAAAGGDAVTLAPDDDGQSVAIATTGGLSASIRTEPHLDDHPGAHSVAFPEFTATIGREALAQLARLIPAISTEEMRYYLNGICVEHVADWTWRFVATDGHRLHIVEVPLPDFTGALPDRAILPRAMVNHLLRHFAKAKDGITLRYGRTRQNNTPSGDLASDQPGWLMVDCTGDLPAGTLTVAGKLIDGTYPDYRRAIPAEFSNSARFARADLARVINALNPFGERGKNGVRALKLSFTPGTIRVSISSAVLGDATLTIAAEHDCPPDFEIGFNGNYLLQLLNVLHGSEVVMRFTSHKHGNSDPVAITDPADTAFKAILMPMRV